MRRVWQIRWSLSDTFGKNLSLMRKDLQTFFFTGGLTRCFPQNVEIGFLRGTPWVGGLADAKTVALYLP